ncbi:MAG: outer membrane lipoprotein carrier protein LolA [Mediterranea sp.]|jgi:outer membrane lipoprotein carrier protein|nr:outer membrane lipoprotein carrier protein LolA [Mediterranea sp.]
MKALIISMFFAVLPASLYTQDLKAVDEDLKKTMIQRINRTASSLETMQCEFEQTKYLSLLNDKMVSKGKMYYKQNNLFRWEYNTPYNYIFILNGTKVILKSSQKKDEIDVRSSRLFQEIANIIMNSVTGKCLTGNTDFKVTMYANGHEWIADLVPLKKEMKQMFNVITISFDPDVSMVSKVEMKEKSGDTTRIILKNVRSNITVDEKIFSLD